MKKTWEQRKLGEISNKISDRNKTDEKLPVLTNSAEYGIINQNKFFDKQIANKTDNYYIVKNNDFVYNPRISKLAPYGPVRRNLLSISGLMSPLYYVFRPHSVDFSYLEFYFKSSKWYKFMYQNGDSGARSDRFAIKDSIFCTMPIKLPSPKEQTLVGELLRGIEKLLSLQQRKLEQLKQLKKVMLQRLFVQNKEKLVPIIRFNNFNIQWRLNTLNGLQENVYSGLSGKTKIDFGHGDARYITYLNVHDNIIAKVSGIDKIEKDLNQNKVEKGDILFTISSEVPEEVALNSVWPSNYGKDLYLNSFCFGYRPIPGKVNPFFLSYYLRTPFLRKNVFPLAQGISRFNISKKNILNISIAIPSLEEQNSIYKLLAELDKILDQKKMNINQFKAIKKFLLQKLFI
ncbi:restriction endonuclease subunit S [Limosilactobacillus sp. c11Ua_112_M]|uniref:restriction endonuclease subunit S n=1 Tax=Limosilactobacillus portuensis TaxID=2742601 RepID=UPI0017829ED5|nr:restriction endonuclease subunit S [Limosilactobacillus portuensis]MBD8086894.1 restriction endonuclease subunit S [Limosilactobacillus portuensis]